MAVPKLIGQTTSGNFSLKRATRQLKMLMKTSWKIKPNTEHMLSMITLTPEKFSTLAKIKSSIIPPTLIQLMVPTTTHSTMLEKASSLTLEKNFRRQTGKKVAPLPWLLPDTLFLPLLAFSSFLHLLSAFSLPKETSTSVHWESGEMGTLKIKPNSKLKLRQLLQRIQLRTLVLLPTQLTQPSASEWSSDLWKWSMNL